MSALSFKPVEQSLGFVETQEKPTDGRGSIYLSLSGAAMSLLEHSTSSSPLQSEAVLWFQILNGKEHIYVPFVHIIYTGQWCHSFYDCVTFFIVYPKTDSVPLTPRFTGLQLQWQSFRRACWHLANTEEENKSWHFIGSKRAQAREKVGVGGRLKRKGKERRRDFAVQPFLSHVVLKRHSLLGII